MTLPEVSNGVALEKEIFVGAVWKVALSRSRTRSGTSWKGRDEAVGREGMKGPEANGDECTRRREQSCK